jgi:hypothetical protein
MAGRIEICHDGSATGRSFGFGWIRLLSRIEGEGRMGAAMTSRAPTLKVAYPSGRVRALPLYDSSKPRVRTATVYMVKTLRTASGSPTTASTSSSARSARRRGTGRRP